MSHKLNVRAALFSLLVSGICMAFTLLLFSGMVSGRFFWLSIPISTLVGVTSLFASYTGLERLAKRNAP